MDNTPEFKQSGDNLSPVQQPGNYSPQAGSILESLGIKSAWDFIEAIPTPVFIKDTEHRYIACNRLMVEMFEQKDYADMLGRSTGEVMGAELAEDHYATDIQVHLTGRTVTYESSYSGNQDKYKVVLITKTALKSPEGEVIGIAGIITDISEIRALQAFNEKAGTQPEADQKVKVKEAGKKNESLLFEIAQRARARLENFRSESRLEIALKALNAGAWEWEPNTGRLAWSNKCYEIFDVPEGEVTVDGWMEKVHPDDAERVKTMWSRITSRPGWFELEFRIHAHNAIQWIRKSGYYFTGTQTSAEKVSGVMVNVSEEKYFNERLLESQRFFKAIVEDQTELICRIRPDSSITFVNHAFARFFNKPVPVLLTLTLKEVIAPKDYLKIRRLLNLVKPVSTVVNFDHKIEKPGSGTAMMQWTIRAIYNQGNVLSEYQFVGRDISEIEASREALRKSEEMFRLIAENSNDIISVHSISGEMVYVSPSVKNILGYAPWQMVGLKAEKIIYEQDLPNIARIRRRLAAHPAPVLIVFRMKDIHGKLIWFESMIQIQRDSHGNTTGKTIVVTREISARKQAEEQQKMVEEQLKEANLAKDKFFSIIAHDLRSPFTSILGFSRLLYEEYEDFDDDERKTMVQQILAFTENAFQLLDNLLAWAKTQMGHTHVYPEVLGLQKIISDTVMVAKPQADAKGIRIVQLNNHAYNLLADMNMTKTIIRNLLSNAIKYSFDGSRIELRSSVEGDMVRIAIIDYGTGMDKETLNTLFKIDEKMVSARGTANETGTGLGLILVKEFIARNGGTIQVESEEGIGSTFSFTLPLSREVP